MNGSKSQRDLPEWFSLDDYDFCSSLPIEYWLILLNYRHSIRSCLRNRERNQRIDCDQEIEELFQESVEVMSAMRMGEFVIDLEIDQPPEVYSPFHEMNSSVEPMTIGAFETLWSSLREDEEIQKFYEFLIEDKQQTSFYEAREYWQLQNQLVDDIALGITGENEWHGEGNFHLRIDVAATEEQLVQDFRKYVREIKARLRMDALPVKNVNMIQTKKWHEQKVLPYLDLTLWCEYKGMRITQQRIGSLLFPDEIEISLDERVRKTVRPLAEQLISYLFLLTLNKQVDAKQKEAE